MQPELIQQVLLFITQNKSIGMEAVSRFLKPFLSYSILRKQPSSFVRELMSSIASLSCSFLSEAVCIMKLLTGCLKYFPCSNEEDFKYLIACAEYLVDAFMVLLKQMVSTKMVFPLNSAISQVFVSNETQ